MNNGLELTDDEIELINISKSLVSYIRDTLFNHFASVNNLLNSIDNYNPMSNIFPIEEKINYNDRVLCESDFEITTNYCNFTNDLVNKSDFNKTNDGLI